MPEMTPVGNIGTGNSGLDMYSKILGIRQAQQNLQTGAYSQQQASATAQQETQTAKQRAALGNWDFTKYDDGTGVIDTTKAAKDGELRKAAGDSYPALLQQLNSMRSSQLQGKKDYLGLQGSELDLYGKTVGGLATDEDVVAGNAAGKQKIINALSAAKETAGPEYAQFLDKHIQQLDGVQLPKTPNKLLINGIRTSQLQALDASSQVGATTGTPGQVQTTEGVQPTMTAPAVSGGGTVAAGPPLKNATPPGTYVNAAGQVQYLPPGGAPGNRGGGSGVSGSGLGGNPTNYAVDAVRDSVKAGNELTNAARTNDRDYGTNVHISNVIRQLSKDTKTGPGTEMFHRMLAGSVKGLGQDAGSDYQLIGSMLDRQAAMAQASMGLPETNAGLQTSQSLSGNTQFGPEALQTKNNLTQALVEGAHQFRHGLDRVAGFGPITNPDKAGKVRQFQAEWTDNFDPNAYRLWTAHKTGDADEIARLRKELNPTDFKALGQKMRNLKSLSETGALPQ